VEESPDSVRKKTQYLISIVQKLTSQVLKAWVSFLHLGSHGWGLGEAVGCLALFFKPDHKTVMDIIYTFMCICMYLCVCVYIYKNTANMVLDKTSI